MDNSRSKKNGKPSQIHASLKPIGRELCRLTQNLASRQRTDRWSGWARSLASRHGAISRVGTPATMILAASGVVERILRERWIGTGNLYPTVKLSVRQILGQIRGFSGRTLTRFNRQPFSFDLTSRSRDGRAASVAMNAGNTLDLQHAPRTSEPGYRPIGRIFLRLNDTNDFSPGRARTMLLQEALNATKRRVIENTQRLEDRTARSGSGASSFVFKQTARPNIPANTTDWADDRQIVSERERQFPYFDVDALTDHVIRQIDQRATAWRERMGKI